MDDVRSMLEETWPIYRVRIRTPRLELRLPTEPEIAELLERSSRPEAVHAADTMPFAGPWTDEAPEVIRRRGYQWHLQQRSSWSASGWHLLFGVFVDGDPVGAQDMGASEFAIKRGVTSGSWLLRSHHGCGLGTEMREAMLHLAFDGLGALAASSGAWEGNAASQRVSAKAGYSPNGVRVAVRGRGPGGPDGPSRHRAIEHVFRIEREAWLERRRDDIELVGLDAEVLAMFGAEPV